MLGIELRPMTMGEILDRSFQLLRRHFKPLFLTALVGSAPVMVTYTLAGIPTGAAAPTISPSVGILFFAAIVVGLLLMAAAWGALVSEADQAVRGEPLTMGAALKTGMKALPRMVGAVILVYLALLGVMLPVGIVAGIAAAMGSVLGDNVAVYALIAVAIAVPAIMAFCVWAALTFLILPVLINERKGPIKALRRANELARGARVRVSAVAILSWVIVTLPTVGIPFLLGMGLSIWDPTAVGTISTTQLFLYQALSLLAAGVTTPFLAAAMVLTYHDRRVRREGADLELTVGAEAQPA